MSAPSERLHSPESVPAYTKPIDLLRLRSSVPQEIFELPGLRAVLKAAFLAVVLLGALAIGTSLDSVALRLLIGVAMGPFLFAFASLGHESGHCTASRWRFVNDLTGLMTMSAIGIPARGWKVKHDLHHKFGGVPGEDTDKVPLLGTYLRLWWPARFGMRLFKNLEFLVWWATPISIWVTTWVYAVKNLRRRSAHHRRSRRWTMVDMAVSGAFFAGAGLYTYAFGWTNLLMLVALPFAVSGIVGAVCFVPNHRGMPPLTAEQARNPARFSHVNSRTVLYPPFVPANFFMNHVPWQIEHHIFPTVAGHRLRELSPHIRDYFRREGIPLTYERAHKVMPRMLSDAWLWGESDGRLYTYAEAEALRRTRSDDSEVRA